MILSEEQHLNLQGLRISGEGVSSYMDGDDLVIDFEQIDWPFAIVEFDAINIESALGMEIEASIDEPQEAAIFAYNGLGFWNSGMQVFIRNQVSALQIMQSRAAIERVQELFPGMRGKPGNYYELWAEGAKEADPSHLTQIRIEIERAGAPVRLRIHAIHSFGTCIEPTKEISQSQYPVVDGFGQYAYADWPGKIHSIEELRTEQQREVLELKQVPADRDCYGGWATGPQLEATGHFRTQKYNGKWWLVDPLGHLFWSHGADGMRVENPTKVDGREMLFPADIPSEGDYHRLNLQRRYADENWEVEALETMLTRLKSWGMNTIGSWSDDRLWNICRQKVPYTVFIISLLRDDGIHGRGNLDDEWIRRTNENVEKAAKATANDPYCIGYFVDNEIHAGFTADQWNTYYKEVSKIIKKHAPNKLYLGSRMDFHRFPRMEAIYHEAAKAAATYCDVVSFNQYRYTLANLQLPDQLDRPLMIGEFHFGALDRGILHTGLRPVISQQQRAQAYEMFVGSALRSPYLVGTHWFTYLAQPLTGRFDGENYQIGLVDVCDTPYSETIEAIRNMGYHMYDIRMNE